MADTELSRRLGRQRAGHGRLFALEVKGPTVASVANPDPMEPRLTLWLDDAERPTMLRCAGTLERGTEAAVLGAVSEMLAHGARSLVVDVTDLAVDDLAGARALVEVQRMAGEASAEVTWKGLRADHAASGRTPPGAWAATGGGPTSSSEDLPRAG